MSSDIYMGRPDDGSGVVVAVRLDGAPRMRVDGERLEFDEDGDYVAATMGFEDWAQVVASVRERAG